MAAACSALASCGGGGESGTPTTPFSPITASFFSSTTMALRPGLQIVQFIGYAFSSVPEYPPCSPIGVPREGTMVWTKAMLVQEGNEWVARSVDGLGDLEFRLHATGENNELMRQVVVGTVRGRGIDSENDLDVRGMLASADGSGAATFVGERLSPYSYFIGGRVSGRIEFSDSAGNTSTCSAVSFTMQPY